MLQRQVKKALRFVDTANDTDGKHYITGDIIKLQEKHPKAEETKQSTITSTPETKTGNVIFENITQDKIASSAKVHLGMEDQPGFPHKFVNHFPYFFNTFSILNWKSSILLLLFIFQNS